MNPRVVYIKKKYEHHSSSSGYDRILHYLSKPLIIEPQTNSPSLFNILKKTKVFIKEPWAYGYNFGSLISEIKAVLLAHLKNADILHFIYGEEQVSLLTQHRKVFNKKIIGTFHLPEEKYDRFNDFHDRIRRTFDGIITVSSREADYWKYRFDDKLIEYIPHGIDIHEFKPRVPSTIQNDKLKILIIGRHMRNFELIRRCIEIANHEKWNVQWHVVGIDELNGLSQNNIIRYKNIAQSVLINLYQKCDVLFLPLHAATANNSILESIACGLPVVTSNISGITDYLTDQESYLFDNKSESDWLQKIYGLSKSSSELRGKAILARKRAEEFSWESIVERMESYYSNIL